MRLSVTQGFGTLGTVARLAVAATGMAACGSAAMTATHGTAGGPDAGASADAAAILDATVGSDAEAGTFPCGSAVCAGTQVCIFPLEECSVPVEPPTDAGACPDGTVSSAGVGLSSDVGPGCVGSPICQRGFAPFCGSQDQCAQDAALWGYIYAHVDAGDSTHVCFLKPPP